MAHSDSSQRSRNIHPSKIICVGTNYSRYEQPHLDAQTSDQFPLFFLKAPNSVVGPNEAVCIPPGAESIQFGAELALVIGERAKSVPESAALEILAGYTCANDVTVTSWMTSDLQWMRAKSSDGFCPLSAVLSTDVSHLADLPVEWSVKGGHMSRGSTSDLILGPAKLVSLASQYMTLEAGDVILTGTPGDLLTAHEGDVMVVRVGELPPVTSPVNVLRSDHNS